MGFSRKNAQIPNFVKIRQVGAEFFHADRRTDMTKPTDAFRNFANAPNKKTVSSVVSGSGWGDHVDGPHIRRGRPDVSEGTATRNRQGKQHLLLPLPWR